MNDIFNILSSKACNVHYLKRYVKFIQACKSQHLDRFEIHHICPKSKDMFPEFKLLREHAWNKCKLTPRQHFVAHWMLWKAFGKSQTRAFWRFNQLQNKTNTQCKRVNSKVYDKLKLDFCKNQSILMKGKPKSKEHAAKLRQHLRTLNTPERNQQARERMTRRHVSIEERQKIAIGVSIYVSNTIWITNGFTNKRISIHEEIPTNWKRGRIISQDHFIKMRGKISITNGIISKKIFPHEEIPVGWKYGMTKNLKDRIWVTNGIISKLHLLNDQIPAGWIRGRLSRTSKPPLYS